MDDVDRIEALKERYLVLAHAVQTGIAATMGASGECEPKHLRTGINTAHCSHKAIVDLLLAKGLVTMEEYLVALCLALEEEVCSYEQRLHPRMHLARPETNLYEYKRLPREPRGPNL